ncbi:MAG: cation:proton antiporter [Verrucomicrobia bacterium]|nr:MAG: cation:proton antiporter [Verrucomicrobiota bacterium]
MNLVLALCIGILFTAGIVCLLQRCMMRLVVGLILLGQAANLIVFTGAGLTSGEPALVAEGAKVPPPGAADALPQAMVLTAIVIGFGLTVFALTLLNRARETSGHDDLDAFSETDRI